MKNYPAEPVVFILLAEIALKIYLPKLFLLVKSYPRLYNYSRWRGIKILLRILDSDQI
jgi:hypothetical protein